MGYCMHFFHIIPLKILHVCLPHISTWRSLILRFPLLQDASITDWTTLSSKCNSALSTLPKSFSHPVPSACRGKQSKGNIWSFSYRQVGEGIASISYNEWEKSCYRHSNQCKYHAASTSWGQSSLHHQQQVSWRRWRQGGAGKVRANRSGSWDIHDSLWSQKLGV
jgi:hypothetical protein